MLTIAMAVFVAQAGPEPVDEISDQVRWNIHVAVRSGDSAALVTIASSTAQTAKLHVEQTVQGELPEELTVSTRGFAKPDLEGGTRLLVFFRNKQPSGHYELVDEGKIRQYPVDVYLARTRWEMTQTVKPRTGGSAVTTQRTAPAGHSAEALPSQTRTEVHRPAPARSGT